MHELSRPKVAPCLLWIAANLAASCLGITSATKLRAAETEYFFEGIVSQTTVYGTAGLKLPADVTYAAPLTGVLTINDSAPLFSSSSGGAYSSYNAVSDLRVTVGGTTYTKTAMTGQYAFAPRERIEIYDNLTSGTPGILLDGFEASVGSEDTSDRSNWRQTRMTLALEERSPVPQAITSSSLAGLQLSLSRFTSGRTLEFYDSSLDLTQSSHHYMLGFTANITSLFRRTQVGDVSGGSVVVADGNQAVIGVATEGTIDASAGSAEVASLDGATLNTGAGGATVTTLSSGTINTSGGTVTTEGGTFTGSITGSGGLSMDGDGTLRLESANTFGGGTFINSGTIEIARGDAIGSAPIRIANNGKFRAVAGVAVANRVVAASPEAIYEHVLGESDLITNLAPISNGIATADIAAGDSAATTVTSNFNANGSVSLSGLNGTSFLMVLDLSGYIPQDATVADHYLGWLDATANDGDGGWVNAVVANIGEPGTLAGSYTTGYQAFLDANGGWDGTTMLGAYGLDLPNQQVWAVIDHNSDFGVTNNGILVVPEPGTLALAGLGLAGIAAGWRHRHRRTLVACLGIGLVAASVPEAASAQDPIEVTGGTAATIPGTYVSGTYPSVLVSGTSSTLTVNEPLMIQGTFDNTTVLTIQSNGQLTVNADVTLTNEEEFSVSFTGAIVGSGGVLDLQSGTLSVGGSLQLSGATAFQRTAGSYLVRALDLSDGAAVTFRAGDQLNNNGVFTVATSVAIATGASLTLEQNLAADFVTLIGAGSTLSRTAQTLTLTELTISDGANLDLIAGDFVDGISVGNYDPGQTGSSTVNLAPGATGLSAIALGLLSNGSIPQLATIPYAVDYLALGGQSLTYRSSNGIEDTIRNFVDVGDNATLTLEKDLTLTGENGGLLLASGGAINRNGFSVSAPSLYLQTGGSFTLDATATVTDSVSVNVFDAAETATLTLAENLVLTGETAPFGRGLSLSGAGATLVRGEGITITATAADTELRVANSADFTVRAGDTFTGARLVAESGGLLKIASAQEVATVSVAFTDFETSAPAILTVNAPLTITGTDPGALAVDGGGQLAVNADVAVGDVVVSSFSDTSVLSLSAGTFTADTMTVTSSSVTRSGGVYDIGTLTLQGSSMTFQAGDSLAGLALEDVAFPTEAAAAFSTATALSLDSLSILGTSALTLGSFDGSDAFVSDYGLRLAGDKAADLEPLVTAGRIIAPNFGELTIFYDSAAGATYVSTVPEPAGLSLAAFGLAAAAALRRRAGSRRDASDDRA
jgi:fibronectin-binding autotransporter adhesin